MDYRTAHIRQSRASKRLKTRLTGMAMLGVVISVGALMAHGPAPQFSTRSDVASASPAPGQVLAAPAASAAQAAPRRVYPYSIVPGGVRDRAELLHVLKTDKVVAAHYAAFQADKAVPVTVAKPRAVYVSYRKGDQVFWTSRKVMLKQGETLLSDGASEIRTRCGNRISDTAQLPVAPNEPSQDVLDTAADAPDDDAGVQAASFPTGADSNPGGVGPLHNAVTFASGNGLIQGDGAVASPTFGLPGSTSPVPGLYGPTRLPVTTQAVKTVQAIQPAQSYLYDPAVSGAGSGDTGSANTVTPSTGTPSTGDGGGTPVLVSTDDTPAATKPELPSPPDTLSPAPSTPIAPAKPAAKDNDVPEPGSLWLSGVALAAMLLLRRKGGTQA